MWLQSYVLLFWVIRTFPPVCVLPVLFRIWVQWTMPGEFSKVSSQSSCTSSHHCGCIILCLDFILHYLTSVSIPSLWHPLSPPAAQHVCLVAKREKFFLFIWAKRFLGWELSVKLKWSVIIIVQWCYHLLYFTGRLQWGSCKIRKVFPFIWAERFLVDENFL